MGSSAYNCKDCFHIHWRTFYYINFSKLFFSLLLNTLFEILTHDSVASIG